MSEGELVRSLGQVFGERDPARPRLTVMAARLISGRSLSHVEFVVSEGDGRRWRVRVPVDRVDLTASISAQAFLATMRANLQEWWDLKDVEPAIEAWASLEDE
jgi:hypothetical protein